MQKVKNLAVITLCSMLCFCGLLLVFLHFQSCYADTNLIEMTFCYKDKIYRYSTQNFDNTDNFYFKSQGQKYGRMGTNIERAELLQKVRALGFTPKETCNYCFKGLDKVIENMQKDINCEPKDATLTFKPNLAPYFFFAHEKIGYHLDLDNLLMEVIQKLRTDTQFTINLQPKQLLPNVYYKDLVDYANLRGSFYTTFSANENRSHNIALAISKFNGMKIEIGKEYSFNETTGRRTEKNGYKSANIIVDKKYVEGYGGGVCQASTTLYNAILLAGLDFCELHSHSLASSYVNMGFDAMVNFGSSDLRWVNNTDTKMFIRTYVQGNRVGVEIYGKPEKVHYTYKRVTEIEEQIAPQKDEVIIDKTGEYANLVTYKDETAYITYPKNGHKVRAILEKYDGERLVERKLLRRVSYGAVRGVKVVGAKDRPNIEEKVEQNVGLSEQIRAFWQNQTSMQNE